MNYVPLGFRTDYSLLKSLLKVNDIVDYALKCNKEYVGILDENPYAIMDFYDKCTKNNLKPIFGMIVNFGEVTLYLYIKDYEGYKSILKINKLKGEEKLSLDVLFKYNKGLIVVLPLKNYNLYGRLKPTFEVYLGYKNETELKRAYQICKNVLFINEIFCFSKKDIPLLNVLYKISDTKYESDFNYVLEPTDFDKKTIDEFASKIDLKFDFSKKYIPSYCNSYDASKEFLYNLAIKGLSKRMNAKIPKEYADRLSFELSVITKMGFVDYFLIVYDYVKYAKKNGIYVGPGRGSAAGSLVSYSLGITEIDPIKYDLLFERFLNPERVTMPDIDIDFEDTRRGEVIDYVRERYGINRVALIVAYGTLGSRQALRDVCKVSQIDNALTDELCKKVDAKKSLKENLKDENLVKFIKNNKLENAYKISIRLEGLKRHTTVHAAGVVISSENLNELIPTFKTHDGILTGFTMEYLEKLGLLKMDFLSLKNLSTIHNIVNLIRKKEPEFNLKMIPLNDIDTFKVFKNADTDNIFQFESRGMKSFLRKLEPSTFDDLAAANALFRPGPMQNIDEYVARRKGLKKITYPHPDLEPILKNTYGIIVYQEQIMQILSKMGGYSFAEADIIRRAMSKKKHDVMEKEKTVFIQKSQERGYTLECASQVYDLIVKFADYGFNKSHSVAYALVGYQMAYLKAHYLELFHLNTLNMSTMSDLKVKDIIEDAKNMGLKIEKPDINKSTYEYNIENGKLILPLTAIKNISSLASKSIVDNQPYNDYFDVFKKVYGKNVNKSILETLIKAGALDSFNMSKNTLLENIDTALTYVELANNLDESLIMKPELIQSCRDDDNYSDLDIFGFYIDGHPSSKYIDKNILKIKDLKTCKIKNSIMVLLVDKIKVIDTKKGDKMAFVEVSDETGTTSAVIFPSSNDLINNIATHELYKFKINIGERNGEKQVILNEIIPTEK